VETSGSKSLQDKSLGCMGFLTAVEDAELGWVGGYLVLNAASRPLEFHCTAPVKPNRAQQILYGPTLAEYVCGEQIGGALTKKSNVEPSAIFTDIPAMLTVRTLVDAPVSLLASAPPTAETSTAGPIRIDAAHNGPPKMHSAELVEFQHAKRHLAVSEAFADDQQKVVALLEQSPGFELDEPFQRIHEAIAETQLRKR